MRFGEGALLGLERFGSWEAVGLDTSEGAGAEGLKGLVATTLVATTGGDSDFTVADATGRAWA